MRNKGAGEENEDQVVVGPIPSQHRRELNTVVNAPGIDHSQEDEEEEEATDIEVPQAWKNEGQDEGGAWTLDWLGHCELLLRLRPD